MTAKEKEKQEAIENLKKHLSAGDTVYCVLRRVSSSGMSRKISLCVFKDNKPLWITWWAAKALGWRFDEKTEAIHVNGCGMDMGFHTVYTLSRVLFEGEGEDPGYKLNQRWL